MKIIYFLSFIVVFLACDNNKDNSSVIKGEQEDPTIAVISYFMSNAPGFDGFVIKKPGTFIAASGYTSGSVFRFTSQSGSKVIAENLLGPVHILLGQSGKTFVSNFRDGTIKVINDKDSVLDFVSGLDAPVGMAQDKSGNIYVANYGANNNGRTITKILADGQKATFITSNLISGPIDALFASDNNLYVSNWNDGSLIKVSNGKATRLLQLPSKQINHMIFFNGYFYITSSKDNKIYRSDLNGNLQVFSGQGSELTKKLDSSVPDFTQLNGIATDGIDLYVSNISGQIWKINFLKD